MLESFGLARPWALALLLAVPLWVLWRGRQRRRAVPYAPLQYAVAPATQRLGTRLLAFAAPALETLLLAALAIGLAGPYRETRLELVESDGIDVMLALDVSLSMLAEDIEPNRLQALRRIVGDLLARAGGNRVGIVIFAADAYVQTPLTTDHRSLAELVDGITVHTLDQSLSGGTAIGDALLMASERLAASRVEGRDQSLILITDGESNEGIEPQLAARWVAEEDIRLYVVGVGGTEPVRVSFEGRPVGGEGAPYLAVLDDARLQALADAGGGRYWRATDLRALEQIFDELSRLESAPFERRVLAQRQSYASWLALAAFFLFTGHLAVSGLALRRPIQ